MRLGAGEPISGDELLSAAGRTLAQPSSLSLSGGNMQMPVLHQPSGLLPVFYVQMDPSRTRLEWDDIALIIATAGKRFFSSFFLFGVLIYHAYLTHEPAKLVDPFRKRILFGAKQLGVFNLRSGILSFFASHFPVQTLCHTTTVFRSELPLYSLRMMWVRRSLIGLCDALQSYETRT
ncbi:hypothetical protein CDAR_399621 [Caerostris darwini]|uniref:Uncharacterized protein n=1 Tax=Caerostris darwini TaxID=1538125 RepID=A0AAV4RNV3_9ARAC|nr:hypothetical protein CDAR_399621 [Caerostris darwini]